MSKDKTLYETFFYKERLANMAGPSTLISALKFKNDVLISLDQSREHIDGEYDGYEPDNDYWYTIKLFI